MIEKTTVHIQKRQTYPTRDRDKVTLCDLHLQCLDDAGNALNQFAIHFVTLRDADIMEGVCRTKKGKIPSNIRRRGVLPPVVGPSHRQPYITQIDWCEDCFDHPSRALTELALTDL